MWHDPFTDLRRASQLRDVWAGYRAEPSVELRDRLIVAYAPLVKYVASRVAASRAGRPDEGALIADGMRALLAAINDFQGLRFASAFEPFAIPRIESAILRGLGHSPDAAAVARIEDVHRQLEHRLGRWPTAEEISEAAGSSPDELQEALVLALAPGTERPAAALGLVNLSRLIPGPAADAPERRNRTLPFDSRVRVIDAMLALPAAERLVFVLYHTMPLSLRDVSEVVGERSSHVLRLYALALLRLRATAAASGSGPSAAALREEAHDVGASDPREYVVEVQARRNRAARHAFVNRHAYFTASHLRSMAGEPSAPDAGDPESWQRAGLIFSLGAGDTRIYPAFQFADGRPKPAIRPALEVLRAHGASEWEIALWFGSPSPWLSSAPAELLDEQPEAVAEAALRLFEVPV